MPGNIEINVDIREFERLHATLQRMSDKALDELMRAVVNEVAIVRLDRMIQARLAGELGVAPSAINSFVRSHSNPSDFRHHVVRSSWLWYGEHKKLDGTRLAEQYGAVFSPGQVQVGRFTFRRGFWMRGRNGNEVLMQRLTDARYPIKAIKAQGNDIVQGVIDRLMPAVPAMLEEALDRRVAAYLARR